MDKPLNKKKIVDLWTSMALIFFALIVLWNQAAGNQYGYLIATGGLVLGLIGIWIVLVE